MRYLFLGPLLFPNSSPCLEREENEHGFSLIELVVVVAVLSILAAISIPTFNNFFLKARQAGAASHVDALLKSASIYRIFNGNYPSTWNQINEYYQGGSSGSSFETCTKYGSECNGNEKVILGGQYLITYFSETDKFGISAWRFNNFGPTSKNYSVMGCITSNGGGQYLFKEGAYYQGKPWNPGILDNDGNALTICR